MKALVKKERGVGIWMEDVPVPTIKENEVLIKIRKTSICGTDVHIYNWDAWAQSRVPVPLVIGHEFSGVSAKVGKDVKGLKEGDRVSGEGHITCGLCRGCRMGKKHLCSQVRGVGYDCQGCFAEYFALPAENVFPLPDDVSDELGAILDPFGNAMHTALSCDLVGEDVLITGAGPVGLMGAAIAKKAGARYVVVTDLNDYRLDVAKKLGATRTVNVGRESLRKVMEELGIQEGFTAGLEMSGASAGLNSMLEAMQPGGQVALLGILPPGTIINWNIVIFNMLTLKGIYGREIFGTWYKMCHMLQSGLNIDSVITHHFDVDDFQKGFDAMLSGQSGKVILNW
jgi:threonine 3-dehydrogenase